MRRSQFSDEQMVAILRGREDDGRVGGQTEQGERADERTIYAWRKHFDGMEPSDVKKLKVLE